MLTVVILEKVTATIVLGEDDVELLLLLLGVKLDGTRRSEVVIDTTMSVVVGTTVEVPPW